MDVIIVSKTRMTNAVCVGGVLANGRFVRLLDANGNNQSENTTLKVGEVYTIRFFERREKKPPHVEDILVVDMDYKFTFSPISRMVEYLKNKLRVKIWEGSTELLFDGKLKWTKTGCGYISENGEIPDNSVGFWIPDKPLSKWVCGKKVRYNYPLNLKNVYEGFFSPRLLEPRNFPFVGFQKPINIIPAGTLVRVSLARWWKKPETQGERRCYLQLSGWYGLSD